MIAASVERLIEGASDPEAARIVRQAGLDVLPILERRLSPTLAIDALERVESVWKLVLLGLFERGVSGEVARDVARFQQRVGFLLKYKSYAIKAASPIGYSLFLQNPREGFSFQRHVERKTEVFHILEVPDGGSVFICEYDEWRRRYDPAGFAAWLDGAPDPRYEPFRFRPEPGDVFWIDRLNVVHTVLGCVLEEFATVSTDMVDRLHDQNRGKAIPAVFGAEYMSAKLRTLAPPARTRHVAIRADGPRIANDEPVKAGGAWRTRFIDGELGAERWAVETGAATEIEHDDRRAASLYVMAGQGALILGDRDEVRRGTPPSLAIARGDLVLVAPGAHYAFVNEGSEPLTVSIHRVPPELALR